MTSNFPTDRLITAALRQLREDHELDDATARRLLADIVASLGDAGTTRHLSVIGLVNEFNAQYEVDADGTCTAGARATTRGTTTTIRVGLRHGARS